VSDHLRPDHQRFLIVGMVLVTPGENCL